MAYFEKNPLPEFLSVKSLHLYLDNDDVTGYIVPRFVNLIKLFISHYKRPSVFESIVLRKQLRHLEQFMWDYDFVVEFSEDKSIITYVSRQYSLPPNTCTVICPFTAYE
jgi:hypothetical protein